MQDIMIKIIVELLRATLGLAFDYKKKQKWPKCSNLGKLECTVHSFYDSNLRKLEFTKGQNHHFEQELNEKTIL
jgi:hypothetical protein